MVASKGRRLEVGRLKGRLVPTGSDPILERNKTSFASPQSLSAAGISMSQLGHETKHFIGITPRKRAHDTDHYDVLSVAVFSRYLVHSEMQKILECFFTLLRSCRRIIFDILSWVIFHIKALNTPLSSE